MLEQIDNLWWQSPLVQEFCVKELLEDMERRERVPDPDDLREVRAVEVLEVVGTPAARSVPTWSLKPRPTATR